MTVTIMPTSGTIWTVTNTKRNLLKISAVATAALLASTVASAQLNSTRLPSDISVVVDAGTDVSVVPLITDSPESDLLTYDLLANEIQFTAGVLTPDYDEPLFCFDMGGAQSAVGMRVTDPNGHLIVRDFAVDVSLDYVLGAPSILLIRPAADQQCFWRSAQGDFGLFGELPEDPAVDPDVIQRDRFEPDLSLTLEYQGVPQFVTLGETVSYDLVVTNTGNASLNEVALQEVFPENLGVYSATLQDTNWTCQATGDAVCPVSSLEPDALRFKDINGGGVDITPGDSLTFSIERTVNTDSIVGESIHLHAGVVADPIATSTPFSVAEAEMTVIGQSAGLNVSTSTTQVDDDATITVTVLDGNQNPVPNENVALDDGAGLTFTSATSGFTDVNGEVVFTATTTTAGDYNVSFTAGSLSGGGLVTFDPGPAAIMVAAALDDEAVADGQDAVSINVIVEDAFGNPVDSVSVEVLDDDGLSSLPSNEFTNLSGVASFAPTSTVADSYQIQFSVAGAGTDAVSVDFLPGAASDLAFIQQPSDVQIGSAMTPAVVLRVVDDNGNWVSDDQTTLVQLRLRQNGTTVDASFASAIVINGEAEFANLDDFTSGMEGTGYSFRAVGTTNTAAFFEDSTGTFEVLAAQ